MNFDSHEEFFEMCGEYKVKAELPQAGIQVSIEELFQHFKERLAAEMVAKARRNHDLVGRRRTDKSMRVRNEK